MTSTVDNIRNGIVVALFENWKSSIAALNYRINDITSEEYTIRCNGINRVYTTELVMLCKGIESVTELEVTEPVAEVKTYDEKVSVCTDVMQNLMGSLLGQFVPKPSEPEVD